MRLTTNDWQLGNWATAGPQNRATSNFHQPAIQGAGCAHNVTRTAHSHTLRATPPSFRAPVVSFGSNNKHRQTHINKHTHMYIHIYTLRLSFFVLFFSFRSFCPPFLLCFSFFAVCAVLPFTFAFAFVFAFAFAFALPDFSTTVG